MNPLNISLDYPVLSVHDCVFSQSFKEGTVLSSSLVKFYAAFGLSKGALLVQNNAGSCFEKKDVRLFSSFQGSVNVSTPLSTYCPCAMTTIIDQGVCEFASEPPVSQDKRSYCDIGNIAIDSIDALLRLPINCTAMQGSIEISSADLHDVVLEVLSPHPINKNFSA